MRELNLLNQLRFTRSEFHSGFAGVTEEEGSQRFLPMNSVAWIMGHLAWHEQYYWLMRAQNIVLFPELNQLAAFGKPPAEVSLMKMTEIWLKVVNACDSYLKSLTPKDLTTKMEVKGKELPANIGTMLSRMIYHYWYHTGEVQAIRQLLGHKELPNFVSDGIETSGQFFLDDNNL